MEGVVVGGVVVRSGGGRCVFVSGVVVRCGGGRSVGGRSVGGRCGGGRSIGGRSVGGRCGGGRSVGGRCRGGRCGRVRYSGETVPFYHLHTHVIITYTHLQSNLLSKYLEGHTYSVLLIRCTC